MCDCLAWHPAWAVAAKRAGTKPGIVFSVFMALRHGGPYPLDARSIAMGLGFKPVQVALVLSALIEAEIVDEALQPIGDWSVTERDMRDSVTVTADEHRRTLARERKRRQRDRETAEAAQRLSDIDQPVTTPSQDDSVTVTRDRPLEEERMVFSPSERARDDRVTKREQLLNSALELMRARMKPADYSKFIEQLTEHGRYERFLERGTGILPVPLKEALEKAFAIVQDKRRDAIAVAPSLRREPQFLLPIKRSA
jgi:hypothetical protein